MKSMKIGDYILLILIILILVGLSLFFFQSTGNQAEVVITTPNEEYIYPLDKDGIYRVQGYIGLSVIEVKESQVKFIESSCKNKICMIGSINRNGQFLACLPNGIIASIVSSNQEEVDDVAI
ncbi:MAG: NusG domain II-containing protein [Sphaerochaetaceae bacterium]